MRVRPGTRARTMVAVASMALAGVLLATPAEAGRGGDGEVANRPALPVSVMTRNLYLGADINRPIDAAREAARQGASPTAVTVALANATHETREIVDQTNFPRRSELLAQEIADVEPELIGLQEVALWRSGPLQLGEAELGVPNATSVDYDFLEILLRDLKKAGTPYEAVNVGERADVEAPSFEGTDPEAPQGTVRDVRLTMRDVILQRADSDLTVNASGGGKYKVNLPVTILGRQLDFSRGYNWVDVEGGSDTFRFINTHLEAFSSDIAYWQAVELLLVPANRQGSTVLVCDCNSDPLNPNIKAHDSLPHYAPYRLLTADAAPGSPLWPAGAPWPGGFEDAWVQLDTTDPGWTAGLSELVNDATPKEIDHRIDLVLAKSTDDVVSPDKGEVTGDEQEDRDDRTGLWPSDHAGVVIRLRGLR